MISVLAFSFFCISVILLVCLMATMDRLRIERSMLSIEKAKSEKLKKMILEMRINIAIAKCSGKEFLNNY